MDASRGFEFEPTPVVAGVAVEGRRSRRRPRMVVVAWIVTLAGVVVAASAGRLFAPTSDARPAAIAFADASTPATRTPAITPAPMADLLVLTSPAEANAEITTGDLSINGYLEAGGGTIRMTLEARGNRVIDEATIDLVSMPGDALVPSRRPTFRARFGLPNPRPNGRMIVQVALLDADGRVLDVIRRPIWVGPVLDGSNGTEPDQAT